MVTATASRTRPALPPDGRPRRRARRSWRGVLQVAVPVGCWALALPAALLGPRLLDGNPFTVRAMMLPLAAGGLLLAAVAAVAAIVRRPGGLLAGASAGLFAAWVALTLRTALYGTPFGFDGLGNDKARLTAMATRYSTTVASADHFVAGVPNDYPPLFPWLVGRTAALLDLPAWRLVGPAEILTLSATVLVGYLMWRRIVPDFAALAGSAVALLAFDTPSKSFAVITAAAFVPWALMTFTPGEGGRWPRAMHWLPAGVIGGLIVLTYYGYLIYAAPGLLALAFSALRAAADRRAYLWRLARAGLAGCAVSSWWVVPYAARAMTAGTQMTALRYIDPNTGTNAFPFMEPTVLGAIQLAGLAGIIWYRRSRPWAGPLLYLVAGTYLYRVLTLAWLVVDGHNRQINYTTRLVGPLLATAGILTIVTAAPALARRLRAASSAGPPPGIGAAALAVLLGWVGFTYWQDNMPATRPMYRAELPTHRVTWSHMAVRAHIQPLPSGKLPRFAPRIKPGLRFPAWRVRRAVRDALGPGAAPVTLSWSEYLFAYLPWPGYVGASEGAANAMVRWDDRYAAVRRLARTADPAAFARAAAATPFGPVDVFVLCRKGAYWTWRDVRFRPAQFDPARFDVVTGLSARTVVAIRRH